MTACMVASYVSFTSRMRSHLPWNGLCLRYAMNMRFGSMLTNMPGAQELRQALSGRVQQAADELLQVQIGDLVPAQVIKLSPNGALINLQGARVLLQGASGLKAGAELVVKVTSLQPQ